MINKLLNHARRIKHRLKPSKLNHPATSDWGLAAMEPDLRNLPFSQATMQKLIQDFAFSTVLDVGSGAGTHAQYFIQKGKKVTAVDFGTSIYFDRRSDDYTCVQGDFMAINFDEQFDCVWASHVLEHQPNPGAFIRRCIDLTKEDGILAIIVPPLKHEIVGGHLSLWNAGLLLYQLVFNGLDCRGASIRTYGYNVSVIVRKKMRRDVHITYDSGDITKLKEFFPEFCEEGFNGRIERWNW